MMNMKRPFARRRARDAKGDTSKAHRLSEIRMRQELSQVDLAERLGVTQGAVSKIEAATDPRVSSIRTYLAAMDASLRLYAVVDGEELRITPNLPDDLEALDIPEPPEAELVAAPGAEGTNEPPTRADPSSDDDDEPGDTGAGQTLEPDAGGGGGAGAAHIEEDDEPEQFDDQGLRIVFFKISRTYRPGMSDEDLERNTSGFWRVNWERHDPDYAMAVVDGLVVAVFEIDGWRRPERWEIEEDPIREGRWAFVGRRAFDKEQRWLHVDVSGVTRGQNPVTYYNC